MSVGNDPLNKSPEKEIGANKSRIFFAKPKKRGICWHVWISEFEISRDLKAGLWALSLRKCKCVFQSGKREEKMTDTSTDGCAKHRVGKMRCEGNIKCLKMSIDGLYGKNSREVKFHGSEKFRTGRKVGGTRTRIAPRRGIPKNDWKKSSMMVAWKSRERI